VSNTPNIADAPFGWGGDEFSMRLWRAVYFPGGYYEFHASHDDGVRIYLDGNKILDVWWDGRGGGDVGLNVSPGNHEVKVEYYENTGDAMLEVLWYGPGYPRPDIDPPNGRITSPSNNSATNSLPLAIWAEASDDASGVNFVEFHARYCENGSCSWHPIGTDYSSPYQINWDWSFLTDQHVDLTIHVIDHTGKETMDPGGYVEFDLDRTKPWIVFVLPGSYKHLNSDITTLIVSDNDNLSGISSIQFFAGYNDPQGYWHEVGWDYNWADGSDINWDASGIPDQSGVVFFAYAYDQAGNYQGAITNTYTLDRTPPTSSVNQLPSTSSPSFSVTWTGQDNLAGIKNYDIQRRDNAGPWTDWRISTEETSHFFIGEPGYTYSFRSRAMDHAGNRESWPSIPDASTTIEVLSDNLLLNSGFEDGELSPTNWQTDSWISGAEFSWEDTQSYQGNKSVKISMTSLNDARWIQNVAVQPNTDYRLSGWIKTENVAHSSDLVDAGANLSVYGTYDYTAGIIGTNPWTYVNMTFNTGSSSQIVIAARLGYWYGITTGTAWFDELRLESLSPPSQPVSNIFLPLVRKP